MRLLSTLIVTGFVLLSTFEALSGQPVTNDIQLTWTQYKDRNLNCFIQTDKTSTSLFISSYSGGVLRLELDDLPAFINAFGSKQEFLEKIRSGENFGQVPLSGKLNEKYLMQVSQDKHDVRVNVYSRKSGKLGASISDNDMLRLLPLLDGIQEKMNLWVHMTSNIVSYFANDNSASQNTAKNNDTAPKITTRRTVIPVVPDSPPVSPAPTQEPASETAPAQQTQNNSDTDKKTLEDAFYTKILQDTLEALPTFTPTKDFAQRFTVEFSDDRHSNSFNLRLSYFEEQKSIKKIELDCRAVVASCLKALINNGRRPAEEWLDVSATGWRSTIGVTGQKQLTIYGRADYDYNSDSITFEQRR